MCPCMRLYVIAGHFGDPLAAMDHWPARNQMRQPGCGGTDSLPDEASTGVRRRVLAYPEKKSQVFQNCVAMMLARVIYFAPTFRRQIKAAQGWTGCRETFDHHWEGPQMSATAISISTTRIPLNRNQEHNQDLIDRLEMSTAEMGLTVRTTNCLEEKGIFTVNDLLHCTREDLLSISNFGEKTLEEVYKALEKVGFYRPSRQTELVAM